MPAWINARKQEEEQGDHPECMDAQGKDDSREKTRQGYDGIQSSRQGYLGHQPKDAQWSKEENRVGHLQHDFIDPLKEPVDHLVRTLADLRQKVPKKNGEHDDSQQLSPRRIAEHVFRD